MKKLGIYGFAEGGFMPVAITEIADYADESLANQFWSANETNTVVSGSCKAGKGGGV